MICWAVCHSTEWIVSAGRSSWNKVSSANGPKLPPNIFLMSDLSNTPLSLVTTIPWLMSHRSTERSGQKQWVHWRLQCPTFLRQTFVEWAAQTINKSYWAGEYYRQQRARGCTYQAAVRSLAFKWIRIVYRCWQTGEAYDESRYLKALQRRGSSLLKNKTMLKSA